MKNENLKEQTINKNIVWNDRKRILGLPISFTKYSLSQDRIFLESGLLNSKEEQILLYKVRDISLNRSLFQKIFKVGNIKIISSDASTPDFIIRNILNPKVVKELINKYVEESKTKGNINFIENMNS